MRFPNYNAFVWLCGVSGVMYAGIMIGLLFSVESQMVGEVSDLVTAIASLGLLITAALALSTWKEQLKFSEIRELWKDWKYNSDKAIEFHLREAHKLCAKIHTEIENRESGQTEITQDINHTAKDAKPHLTKIYRGLIQHQAPILILGGELGNDLNCVLDATESLLLEPEGINHLEKSSCTSKRLIKNFLEITEEQRLKAIEANLRKGLAL